MKTTKSMDSEQAFSYRFDSNACTQCRGACCRGHAGYIWISMEELQEMAAASSMDVPLFAKNYLRQVQGRVSLQERIVNGEHLCCFFDPIDALCTIYMYRPEQCRTFPFWNGFMHNPQKLVQRCPGVIL